MSVMKCAMLNITLALFVFSTSAEISAVAYSKDEGLNEKNISKPRIFIENTGTEPISDFYFMYYFTADNDNTPVLENYYTPNEKVSLVQLGRNKYAIRYDCYGVTLYPGEVFPDPNGNIVGIHYQNWESLVKRNDRSCNFSSEFVPNGNIAVFLNDNYHVHKSCHEHQRNQLYRDQDTQVSIDIKVNSK